MWTTATLTPLERPPELAGKVTLTPAAAIVAVVAAVHAVVGAPSGPAGAFDRIRA